MDLDELKETWNKMSDGLKDDAALTSERIKEMARKKSASRVSRMANIELGGVIVTLLMMGYLVMHFNKLETWLDLTGGVGTLFVFLVGIYLGGMVVIKAKQINVALDSYSQTVEAFDKLRKLLRQYKWVSIAMYVVIPIFLMPVISRIWFDKNLLEDLEEFYESVIAAFIILPVIWFVIYKFYVRNIKKIKESISKLK